MDKIKNNFKEVINNLESIKLLDICTGSGEFLKLFINEIKDIKSIDAIDIISKNIDIPDLNINFQIMNSDNLKFKDNSFDIVTLSNSLHHIEKLDKSLLEIKRVLKNDGFFIINEMYSNNLNPAQTTHKLLHHFSADIDKYNNIFHRYTYQKEELIELISKYFKISSIDEYITESKLELNELKNIIKLLISKVDNDKLDYFNNKSNEIINNFLSYGFCNATQLFIICKKH
ncbi:MAG: class I SAM-dependent methyltransferase [Candidatus Sericytochromatia bacterium]